MSRKISRTEVRTFRGSLLDDAALDRILAPMEFHPLEIEGKRRLLLSMLPIAMDQLRMRSAAQEINPAHDKLGRLLRKHGYSKKATAVAAAMPDLPKKPYTWSREMLAGNYLPETVYVALTGKRPTAYRTGPAVKFVHAVMNALIGPYTEEAVIKAMRIYKMAARYKQRGGRT